jgi:hypothetical protein
MIFDEIIQAISKEVIDEEDNIKQVVLTILSSYTDNPQNLRILAPSGEGKTHTVLKTAKYFPKNNILKISEASAKSFKYMANSKVIEVSDGVFEDFDTAVESYEVELSNPKTRKKAEKNIQELEKQAYSLLDFTNMTIIFLDSQSFGLWESLKTTLSHDDVIRKDLTTNKINGRNQIQRTAYKGYPAVIYCSAKDEISKDDTDEINTRFNTISIKGSTKKYKEILKLVLRSDDPTQEIITTKEIDDTTDKINQIIESIESFHGVFNPFAQNIEDNFPCDKGSRARQLKILSNTIKTLTLSKSAGRFSLINDEKQFLISSKSDVVDAINLIGEPTSIATTKIQFFNDSIRPYLLGRLDAATASEIAEYLHEDRQHLSENYLKPFTDHGYLESEPDLMNRSRFRYSLSPRYISVEASIVSTLIDTSVIDISCLKNTLEQRLGQGYKLVDVTGSLVSVDFIVSNLGEIDTQSSKIVPESSSEEVSNDVDNLGDSTT